MDISRIDKWFGGITNNERSKAIGAASNIEEMDIFTSPAYIQPVTIFETEPAGLARVIRAYDIADTAVGYALGTSADGDAEIWSLTDADATNPGAWASVFESTNDAHANGNMAWFKWNSGADYLYYPTVSGTTVTLRSLGDLTTYTEASVGTLDGLDGTGDRVQFVKGFGELYVTNGKYISKVDDAGAFTQHAFTLPTDLVAVSMALRGNFMYILCKFVNSAYNKSRIVVWDLASLTQPTEQIDVSMAGPQWIVNHNETLRLLCSKNGIARVYEMPNLTPIKTHELSNIQTETNAQPISPTNTVFVQENILYFGLWKTDKSGLYALGKVEEGFPLALVLSRRFDTSDYSLHKPYAANAFGPNFYCSFDDNTAADFARIEGNNSPTRSSNAVYESPFIDMGSPEAIKDIHGIIVQAKPIPASCEIKVDFLTDDSSSYDTNSLNTLTNANDYTHTGGTADTYWHRLITSVAGRLVKMRVRFTSSTTSRSQLYSVGILSNKRSIL